MSDEISLYKQTLVIYAILDCKNWKLLSDMRYLASRANYDFPSFDIGEGLSMDIYTKISRDKYNEKLRDLDNYKSFIKALGDWSILSKSNIILYEQLNIEDRFLKYFKNTDDCNFFRDIKRIDKQMQLYKDDLPYLHSELFADIRDYYFNLGIPDDMFVNIMFEIVQKFKDRLI